MPFVHNLNPVLLDLGPLEIRYYGLVYLVGAILAFLFLDYYRKKAKIPLSRKEIYDFVFWLMVGVIIGSRLFLIFWHPVYYLNNPLNLLKIWEGGMSVHGGITGIVLAGYLFCKKKKLDFWQMADLLTVPAVLVLALGRIANFINGELWGTMTDLSWCVYFPAVEGCRHPWQIYEAIKRFMIFGFLIFLNKKKIKDKFKLKTGTIFLSFILLENAGRFLTELVKDETRYLGLTVGQYLAIIFLIIGFYFLVKIYRKRQNGN